MIEDKIKNVKDLKIWLISPNHCALDFLKKHGERIMMLKIEKRCKVKDFLDIVTLVPNCKSLDLTSIEFEKENNQTQNNVTLTLATMMKLNEIHAELCDDANDIFWRSLYTPALKKLTVDINEHCFYKLCEIFDKNQQLKVLELNLSKRRTEKTRKPLRDEEKRKKRELVFNSLKNITLEKIYYNMGKTNIFLIEILKLQPELKVLNAHLLCDDTVETIFAYALNLEILKLNRSIASCETLSNINNLTKLKHLKMTGILDRIPSMRSWFEYQLPKDFEPQFIASLVQLSKNIRHLELSGKIFYTDNTVSSILNNYTQLENVILTGMSVSLLSSDSFISCANPNLKVLKLFECIPVRLFAKFIFNFPNLETLEICTLWCEVSADREWDEKKMKLDESKIISNMIKNAKESTENKEKIIADLIEGTKAIADITANSLLQLQLTLIQLGWSKLITLKISSSFEYFNIHDELVDLINANQNLKSIEILGNNFGPFNNCFNEELQERFNEITIKIKCLLLKNTKDEKTKTKFIKVRNREKNIKLQPTTEINCFYIHFLDQELWQI
jgi:hypothetical protein